MPLRTVKNPDLKSFLNSESQERERFVSELQHQVQGFDGEPATSGSTAGALHRAWIEIKGTLTGKDDRSILSEVERGEDSALRAYDDALGKGLPVNCRPMVERQYKAIKLAHDRVNY